MINVPFIGNTKRMTAEASPHQPRPTAAAAAPPSFLSSVRGFIGFIDKAQPPSYLSKLPSRVAIPEPMRSRAAAQSSDAPSPEDRRRQFLATDCRNSDSDTGLTKTAVLTGSEEYPVGYFDVAPEPEIETKEEPLVAEARETRVSFAEGVEICLAVPAEQWWGQRAAASSEQRQMRATL